MNKEKILIVDDELEIGRLCVRILEKDGYETKSTQSGKEALKILNKEKYSLVIIDLKMPEIDGIELLQRIKEKHPDCDVIIMTGYATIKSAVEAIRSGAFDYILKPFDIEELKMTVRKCAEKRRLSKEVSELKEETALYRVSRAMSSLMPLNELLNLILRLALEALNADSGSIMIYNEQTNMLDIKASIGLDEKFISSVKTIIGERIAGWVAKEGEPILLVDGLKDDPRFKHLESRPEIKSAICTPMKVENKLIGVVNINITREGRVFNKHDLDLLVIFAQNACSSILNARIYEKLQELDRLKSEFVANVSHELRSPLTAITSGLQVYDITGNSRKKRELLAVVKNNAKRMIALVNNLLDFSKIEAGIIELKKSRVSVTSIISRTIDEMKPQIEKKRIILSTKAPSDLPDVHIDKQRITQVCANLISNAIRFTPEEGRIIVSAKLWKSGEGAPEGASEWVEISVEDTGIGIRKELQERIFEKFYQVDGSMTRLTGGFGIGLAIAKSIVEAHGGKIWAESEPGHGAKFTFTIPV